MKRTIIALALALSLPSLHAAETTPSETMRQRFAGEQEPWLLAAILSDDAQKAAFDSQAAEAVKGGAPAQETFTLRWRQKVANFAGQFKQNLDTTDIVPNAPTVEGMATPYEFQVMSYWMLHQTPQKQKEIKDDIAMGNGLLKVNIGRDRVETSVRESRKKAAAGLGVYIAQPDVKKALAFKEPPKAQPALDQAEKAGEIAKNAPTKEQAADAIDKVFSGAPPRKDEKGEDAPVVVVPPTTVPNLDAKLTLPAAGTPQGGFTIKAPPAPLLDQNKPQEGDPVWKTMVKKFAPAAGAVLGGIIGLLLGGPIGMLIGAAAGAALGFGVKKLLSA
ncbi:MAG: hypothetical protein AAB320_04210 [Elusimicrobiota bacterium]